MQRRLALVYPAVHQRAFLPLAVSLTSPFAVSLTSPFAVSLTSPFAVSLTSPSVATMPENRYALGGDRGLALPDKRVAWDAPSPVYSRSVAARMTRRVAEGETPGPHEFLFCRYFGRNLGIYQ